MITYIFTSDMILTPDTEYMTLTLDTVLTVGYWHWYWYNEHDNMTLDWL